MKVSATLLALVSLAAAVPLAELERRELVIETTVIPVVETVVVTTTIGGGESSPSPLAGQKAAAQPQAPAQAPAQVQAPADSKKQQAQAAPAQPQAAPAPSPKPSPSPSPSPTPTPAAAPAPQQQQQQQQQPQQQQQQQPAAAKQASGSSQASSGSASGGSSNFPVDPLFTGATVADGPSSKDSPFKGSATYYYPQGVEGGNTGALTSCGLTAHDTDLIFAPSHHMMGNTWPYKLCNRTALITGPTGKSVRAQVGDMCPGCTNPSTTEAYNIDLTMAVFNAIGGGDGRIDGVSWYWVE